MESRIRAFLVEVVGRIVRVQRMEWGRIRIPGLAQSPMVHDFRMCEFHDEAMVKMGRRSHGLGLDDAAYARGALQHCAFALQVFLDLGFRDAVIIVYHDTLHGFPLPALREHFGCSTTGP